MLYILESCVDCCSIPKSRLWNSMILGIEYHYLSVITTNYKLQNYKHRPLIEKPSGSRVYTKLAGKTVIFQCIHSFCILKTLNPIHIFKKHFILWSCYLGRIRYKFGEITGHAKKRLKLSKAVRVWLLLNFFGFSGSA